ncbi:MAG: O-acetyl-ADP-ribose deacetylase [Clostridiales bacterium]|nr:O-acetyl-ADP-ribose deacetylase [Clostridiales bacterium]
MPFRIVSGDITKLHVDAIVNAANTSLLGGGGVDGAIHRAAGPRLLEECRTLNGCRTGEAKVTLGYDLPAKYVIHTVGPIWQGGHRGEEELLRSAYRNSLLIAREKHCESVAFPMISAGVYGYPKEQALEVAVSTIRAFLDEEENDMEVLLVIFDRGSFRFDVHLYSEISGYIRNTYDEEKDRGSILGDVAKSVAFGGVTGSRRSIFARSKKSSSDSCERAGAAKEVLDEEAAAPQEAEILEEVRVEEQRCLGSAMGDSMPMASAAMPDFMADAATPNDLKAALENLDESFSQSLLRMIDSKGMKDSECYKKANIDRKLFSKIRSDINYRPSKQTVLAFAVALELDLPETEAFLKKAGFALSHSNKADVIVEYFISNKNYDMYSINQALFAFDQNLLGA